MSNVLKSQPAEDTSPVQLHEKAEANLRFIRASMEGASSFTGVSGKGYIIAGVSALIAALIAGEQTSESAWLAVWMVELLFAGGVAFALTALKAKSQGGSLWSTNGKKLLFAFLPTMSVGGVLTLTLFLQGSTAWLPGIWLSLYGAATMTAGIYSIALIPVMGGLFLLTGFIVLLTAVPANLILGLAMGGLHIVFGYLVWRDHGG